nr:metallophosphoesterase [Bacteroidaceae bacterium]
MKFFVISVVILGILFALVPHIIYLLAKLVGFIANFKVTYKYFGFTALGLFVLISVLMTYGYAFGRFRSEVTTLDFESESVPGAFDGYKIVQISDLHLDGWKGNSEHLKKRIDEINAINPDLVCFTGDLVSLSPSEIDGFKPILKELKAKDGVISILGNHDYLPYARHLSDSARWQQVNKVIDAERNDLGWNLLLNENTIIR